MSDPEQNIRPRAGCWILAVPIVIAVLLVGSYGAIFLLGVQGRAPEGPVARMSFSGCDEAEPVIRARVEEMGLGDPQWEAPSGGFALTARLPAWQGATDQIPATLTAPGEFAARAGPDAGGRVLASDEDIASATMRLDFAATPSTAVRLGPTAAREVTRWMDEEPQGVTSLWLDGEHIGTRDNDPDTPGDRFTLEPASEERQAIIQQAAAWAVILNHGALPCPVQVSTTVIEAGSPRDTDLLGEEP